MDFFKIVRRKYFLTLLCVLGLAGQIVEAQTAEAQDVISSLISAQEAFNNEEWAKVREHCLEAVAKDSTCDAAYFLLSRVALQEGKFTDAKEFIGKAIAIDTLNKLYNSVAVSLYMDTRDLARLKPVLRRAIEYKPNDEELKQTYISLLYTTEDWANLEAVTADEMENNDANDLDIIQLNAIAKYSQKKYDEAINLFLSLEPKAKKERDTTLLLDIYAFTGDTYHVKKDNATSFKYYKKALKIDKRYAPVLNNYAWYLATEGSPKEWPKALNMSRITIEDNPDNSTYLDTYGYLQFLLGDYKGARQTFLHALGYGGGESAVSLDHYADVLYALGEYDLAFMYYDKALQQAVKERDTAKAQEMEAKIEGRKKELKKK